MTLNKFVSHLHTVGCIIFGLYLIGSIAWHHTTDGFKNSDTLRYLMYTGVAFMVPLWGYQLWHFKEYKKENKEHLILWTALFVMAVIAIGYKGYRGLN